MKKQKEDQEKELEVCMFNGFIYIYMYINLLLFIWHAFELDYYKAGISKFLGKRKTSFFTK